MTGVLARLRSLWRGLRRRSEVEAQMQEEFDLHVDLRAEDLVRAGYSPAEAARRARLEFGNRTRYREEGLASRGLQHVDALRFSWLDFKLGFRMLARYPALTVVGVLAMSFAIAVGASAFELATTWARPRLPLEDGARLVGIRVLDAAQGRGESRILHDFIAWREQLEQVEDLSAFRTSSRNLRVGDGRVEPIEIAEISASAFRLTRTPARLGRYLVEQDEGEAAPPVVVIGHRLWRERFGGDPGVVGSSVWLGNTLTTVVGVMPEGFAFPFSHEAWTPLRVNVFHFARRQGPGLDLVGRLAPGATQEAAQAKLNELGMRAAADFPETHEHLRPQIMPYARLVVPVPASDLVGVTTLNLFVFMLLVLVCGNVALLLFARATTRESEIVVRNALGASRGRIIMQLFAEALVLGGISVVVGLISTRYFVQWGTYVLEGNLGSLPFWFDDRLSPATVFYAAALMAMAAVIAGVVPALKVTRGLGPRLRQAAIGAGRPKFGGVWTVVIVAQVAVTVAFPSAVFLVQRFAAPIRARDVGFAAEQYLSVRVEMDATAPEAGTSDTGFSARYRSSLQQLELRLAAEREVLGVTFADRLPRMLHPASRIELDRDAPMARDSVTTYVASVASVDADYFDVLGAGVLSGRGFDAADRPSDRRVVVVNQTFVERVLGGRNPVGRHIRPVSADPNREPEAWYEIIGVVKDLGMNYLGGDSGPGAAGFYRPLAPGTAQPVQMAIHLKGDPASFASRLRTIAGSVDPTLRLYDMQPLQELDRGVLNVISIFTRVAVLLSSVALILSLAGIYSVMAFTVSRRTREIGIRVALGGHAWRVASTIFARPLAQIGMGVAAGGALVALLLRAVNGSLSIQEIGMVTAYAAAMLAVCMIACVVPTRRALAVQPTEALREDG